MTDFLCKICGEHHKLVTLLEFPQPDIISEISSGKSSDTMEIVHKNGFVVNRNDIYFQARLIIPIVNYVDEFELLIWIEIEKKEFQNTFSITGKNRKVKFNAILNRAIPFYKNTVDLGVQVMIELDSKDESAKIIEIQREIELRNDLKNGITLDKLQAILSRLYHL